MPHKTFFVFVQMEYFLFFFLTISPDAVFNSLLLLLFAWKSIEQFIC